LLCIHVFFSLINANSFFSINLLASSKKSFADIKLAKKRPNGFLINFFEVMALFSKSLKSKCVSKLSGEINFYLDGHSSGDGTFEGNSRTPIRYELEIIEKNLTKFSKLFVAIDDFRVFGNSDDIYPSNYYLVNFCKKNKLKWKVEQDIFMFTNY
jgi:hypothetical protein